jgi:hypothetical protein
VIGKRIIKNVSFYFLKKSPVRKSIITLVKKPVVHHIEQRYPALFAGTTRYSVDRGLGGYTLRTSCGQDTRSSQPKKRYSFQEGSG